MERIDPEPVIREAIAMTELRNDAVLLAQCITTLVGGRTVWMNEDVAAAYNRHRTDVSRDPHYQP